MKISDRSLTTSELIIIYEDFRKIEALHNISEYTPQRFNFVAEENDRIIGYVSGLTEHNLFYLSDLWVEESHRRKGLGSELLMKMEQKVKSVGIKYIYLWTAGKINPLFYEKHGYIKFTTFENLCEVEGYHKTGYRKDL